MKISQSLKGTTNNNQAWNACRTLLMISFVYARMILNRMSHFLSLIYHLQILLGYFDLTNHSDIFLLPNFSLYYLYIVIIIRKNTLNHL